MNSYCGFVSEDRLKPELQLRNTAGVAFGIARRVIGFFLILISTSLIAAQEVDPDEAKEKSVADKFVTVLEKNPRRGTALDKVYGYHVERGTLDNLIASYRSKTTTGKGAEVASSWMLVGLLESLRGQDALAVAAFERAENLANDNSLASYYLGQSLVLVGQPDKAAEALERSIQRKPAQADLLDVYQALGRVYQRAQKSKEALGVWSRLEKQFPNDVRVQEQIATTLLEENEYEAALPRYEALAKSTKDKYRQSLFQMEAADIKVRLGKSDVAIGEFEKLLGQLNPDNWLFREVRRRIEAVYLRTDDQSGLIAYYEDWIKKNPEDLDSVSRLARLLAGLGRSPEAQAWLEKGLKLAPKKKELRNALIGQLVYEQKYPEAIAQYEQLDKFEPNNPDTLRDWGRLILKDTGRDEATRKKDAAAVWRRLTNARPKDALVASQVSELFRQADMSDEALALYQLAIKLAPDQAQYREYLGEYFHSLKRKDEALATWRAIAAGKLKTAPNLARLAEVLSSFGYLAEAVETNAEACKLDPKDFSLQLKQVDLLAQAEKHEESLQQLAIVKKLAANDEEREAWIVRDLRELQALDKLKERIGELVKNSDETDADRWFWLARAYESERQLKDAAASITRASVIAPQSVPILMASARIHEAQNNLMAAVEINTKLAAIDRRYRTEYLKQVATLEQKLGRRDKAMQAGRDLIAAAPGNPELYEFFSQLCFQLGENEEGLGALRRSVRVNPGEPKGLLLLASALGEQFRTGEAIELYWRAFDKAANLDDRLGVVPKLVELYLQTNQLDRMLERLERQRREPNQLREMTICIAQAYQSAGDDGNARQELEKLLTDETRDVQLLTQLVKLCESDGDLEAAVKFQQLLLKSAPGKDATMRLAQLLLKSGETEEATAMMSRLTSDEKDPEAILKSLDSMIQQGTYDQALKIAEKLTREQPKNWELIYREGVVLAKVKERAAEAAARFEEILAMKLPDDELSLAGKNLLKKEQGRTRSPAARIQTQNLNLMQSFVQRGQGNWQIRQAVGLDNQNNYQSPTQQPLWTPHDFGTARMACFGWLNLLARNEGKEDDFVKQRRELGEKAETDRDIADWFYFASLMNNVKDTYAIVKKMSYRQDAEVSIKSMYLSSLANRGIEPGQEEPAEKEPGAEDGSPVVKLSVLGKDEMDHVLDCYNSIKAATDDVVNQWNFGQPPVQVVVAELKRCGRTEEAETLLKDAIAAAKEPMQIAVLLSGIAQSDDYENSIILLDRLLQVKPDSSTPQSGNPNVGFNYAQYVSSPAYQSQILAGLMAKRAQKKSIGDVMSLWDRYLSVAVTRFEQQKIESPAAKKRTQQQQAQYQQQGYVYVWRGNNQQYEQLDFPASNEIYDQASIQMLRQLFVIYKDADTTRELIDHFQKQLADPKTTEARKLYWQFGLGYLNWWLDEKDEALKVLVTATESLPDNEAMRLELAQLYEKRGEHGAALEIVDSLAATDQQAMQKREISALRLAVNSGNIDRARIAAERLFGLRLDSNLQIQLARQMHQLGMHEQAEAVLSRAGRQAGNKTDVLSSLMQQYQSQGKNDVATQIAHQLLRRSAGGPAAIAGRSRRSGQQDNSGMRQQALAVLRRSGKLPEMIAKIETQLKNGSKSQRLRESLFEYYTANGDEKKATELSSTMTESKQDDPQFQYNLGQQMMQQGKHKEAAEHFKAAVKKDPGVMRNNFWEVMNSFQSADKLEELVSVFDGVDLKKFSQNPWELSNMISNLSNYDKSKAGAVKLFKRAWDELPGQRQQLLQSANNEVFWQLPEIYDYARQGIIPSENSVQQNGGWSGFGQIQNYSGEGKVTTLMTRFLTIATTNNRLDELRAEVEAASKKAKKWDGAKVLLALIDLRRGQIDEAKVVLEKLLPGFKPEIQGQSTRWEIGQELMVHEKCVDLAIQYFEAACKDPDAMSMNGFQLSPGKPLVAFYKQRGRMADARRVLLDSNSQKSNRNRGNEDYEAYQRIQNVTSLGKELTDMGFPVDALRIYQIQLGRVEDFAGLSRVYGGGTNGNTQADRMKKQIETGFQTVLTSLKPELLPELLSGHINFKAGQGTEPPKTEGASIDLVLLLESRELDKTRLSSALGNLVAGLSNRPELHLKSSEILAKMRAERPDDLAISILSTQMALGAKDPGVASADVKQMVEFIEKTDLEPQPAKGGFTTKQRDAAFQQTALWLVARECLKHERFRQEGTKIGQRSLEAARQLADNGFALAILREWGQLAIESGDKTTAEQRWTEMLEIILPPPSEKAKKPGDAKTGAAERSRTSDTYLASQNFLKSEMNQRFLSRWEMMLAPGIAGQLSAPAPARPAKAAAGTARNVVTLAQFEQASQIAMLAAENGLNDLSTKAMILVLQPGPPIESMQAADFGQANPSPRNQQDGDQSQLAQKVEERLTAIEQLWRRKGVSEDVIYEILKNAVLPTARPFEVFLYARPLNVSPNQSPQSVGLLLAKAAVKANKVDEVRQLIEPRLKQPLGELSAHVLLAQLGLAMRDQALTNGEIGILEKRLQLDGLQNSSELACHVAIPAIEVPELATAATGLLERAVGHMAANALQGVQRGNVQEEPMRWLRFALARAQFKAKNIDAGKRHLEDYLSFLIPIYSRYGGDYGLYQRKNEMMKVAAEYARAGLRAESLDCLGRYADIPLTRNYGRIDSGQATGAVLAGLISLPASERFELLKTWSLPTADRQSVRLIGAMIPGDRAPAVFDSLRGLTPRQPGESHLTSTADLLITAAAETKRLDELQAELLPFADRNVENSKFLLLLTRIARGEGNAVNAALQQFTMERRASSNDQNNDQVQMTDLILARAAIADKNLHSAGSDLAGQLVEHAKRVHDRPMIAAGQRVKYSPRLESVPGQPNREWGNVGMAHWTAGGYAPVQSGASASGQPLWFTHEGIVSHIGGPERSQLYLNYPLTGEFDIRLETWAGGYAEFAVGYGGVIYNGINFGNDTNLESLGNRSDTVHKPDPPELNEHFNQIRLEVRKDKVRYFVNEALIHEEPNVAASPWFFGHADATWRSAFRNVRISGNPVIPEQVALVNDNSLLGWVSDFYNETRPNRDPARQAVADPNQPTANQTVIRDFDWWGVDGTIHGRLRPSSSLGKTSVQQSRLFFDRPMLNGEKVSYEFWYESGQGGVHVAPALDRLAFLIEADGVKLHWMTDSTPQDDANVGLSSDNVAIDKSIRRGNIALKEGDWNSVDVTLVDNVASISLNGSLICSRMIEPGNSRQFGFYHDKSATSVKVRRVNLIGNWPKSLDPEILADLLAPNRPQSTSERREYGSVTEEKYHADGLVVFLTSTRALPAEAQFDALKNWVLPGEDHGNFRLYGDFTSFSEIPRAEAFGASRIDADEISTVATMRRQKLGGDLIAPALDLIDVAKKLNRLDDLATLVMNAPADSQLAMRSKLAIQIMLESARGNFDVADLEINRLLSLCKAIPEGAPMNDRWPEMVVGVDAMRYPELRVATLPLLAQVVDHNHKVGLGSAWEGRVTALRDHCKTLIDSGTLPLAGVSSPRGQWSPAVMDWADAHARGVVPRWQFLDGEVKHIAGDSHNYLYFQSPLTGTFQVEADIATYGWRETRLMYHGHWVGPQYTKTVVELGNLTSSWNSPTFDPPLSFNDFCQMKLVVEPGKATFFIADRQVHEQPLPDRADPWLAFMTWGNNSGGAKHVRITGQPIIPDELDLSSRNDLIGWTSGLYVDPVGNDDTAAWVKTNGEIVGKRFDPSPGRKHQSLLRYHRPLVEDSVIDYDFFYVADQTVTHPALGRMAFLLQPDSVKLHWLTDAHWDRSGRSPGNATADPSCQRGPKMLPLKKDDWNHVQLMVVGDTVKLALNDIEVYEGPVGLSNERQFGLFHFADETDVRVKGVTYKGNWPKSLPSLKQQELSGKGPMVYDFAENELETDFTWNFQGPKPAFLNLWGAVAPNRMEPVEGGLKLIRGEKAGDEAIPCGFQWNANIEGDFEATLTYRDFQSKTEQPDWQIPRIEIFFNIGGAWGAAENTHLMHGGIRRKSDGILQLYLGHGIHTKDDYDWKYTSIDSGEDTGRFRYVRKGNTVWYLHANGDSDEWTLLAKGPVSAAPLVSGSFGLRAEKPTSSGEITMTGFTLKSKRNVVAKTGSPPPAAGNRPYEFTSDELATRLEWDFQGPKPRFINPFGAAAPNRIEVIDGGLKLVRGAKAPENGTFCGFLWNTDVSGDFEATINFRDFESQTDTDDWQAPRIELQFDIGGGWSDSTNTHVIQTGLRRRADKKPGLFVGNRIRKGEDFDWKHSHRETQESAGSFRLVRKGEVAWCLHSKDGEGDWTIIYEGPIGNAPLKGGNFGLRTEIPKSSGEVIVTGFVLKTREPPGGF